MSKHANFYTRLFGVQFKFDNFLIENEWTDVNLKLGIVLFIKYNGLEVQKYQSSFPILLQEFYKA